MIKEILAFMGSALGMILKFILIIALSLIGVYCLGTSFAFPLVWEGLIRLGVTAACVLAVIGLLRIGREKDDSPVGEDDFRP